MFFKNISVLDYRNLSAVQVELSHGINVFLGNNGQGKTNFLESLYLLCKGKSFRPAKLEHFINYENPEKALMISSKVEINNSINELALSIENKKRRLFLNKKRTSAAKINQLCPVVLFSPESLDAIKTGPLARRNLVDELLYSHNPNSIQVILYYTKCLKNRNILLQQIKQSNGIHQSSSLNTLNSLDEQLIEYGARLTKLRLEALKALKPYIHTSYRNLTNSRDVEISVDYVISGESSIHKSSYEIKQHLQERLQQLRTNEMRVGSSLVGPHKHDIVFLVNQKDSRYYCSQGQQRALILSFKMAQIVYHKDLHIEWPILFLDDVLSELDTEKREHLIRFLNSGEGQTFITTTDFSLPRELTKQNIAVFQVQNGNIKRNAKFEPR